MHKIAMLKTTAAMMDQPRSVLRGPYLASVKEKVGDNVPEATLLAAKLEHPLVS
jgi:hypothetical protein